MDDTVNIRVRLEDLIEVLLFPYVDIVEFGSLAADELDTIDGLLGGIEEVIHNHDFVVCLQEREGGEGSNVTTTPEDQLVQ